MTGLRPIMNTSACCETRQSVFDGSEDLVVNLSAFFAPTKTEAAEFLDANVLTSDIEELIM